MELLDTSYYNRFTYGRYQFAPPSIYKFLSLGEISRDLSTKLWTFLFTGMPSHYLTVDGILFFQELIKHDKLVVVRVPKSAFIKMRRDLYSIYPDLYMRMIETKSVGNDTITLATRQRIHVCVHDEFTDFGTFTMFPRFLARQLLHELGHFAYTYIKDMRYFKYRIWIPFYSKLIFQIYNVKKSMRLPFLKRFLKFVQIFEYRDIVSLSQLRALQLYMNRFIPVSIRTDEAQTIDFHIPSYWEMLIRKQQLQLDVVQTMWINDKIIDVYKEIWQGTHPIWHKDNLFYQEIILPSEVLARMLEGVQRTHSNKPILQYVIAKIRQDLININTEELQYAD